VKTMFKINFSIKIVVLFLLAKKSSTKAVDLAKNVTSDISTIKNYRSIMSRYEDFQHI